MKDPSQPRMKDVAALLGVHPTTGSLALRSHPSIPEATQLRVRRAAEKLGYRPNPLVSALMSHRRAPHFAFRHTTLAFVTSSFPADEWRKSQTLRDLLAGASERARVQGYNVEEFALFADRMTPPRFNQLLRSRGILGLIIAPLRNASDTLPIEWEHFASVAMAFTLHRPDIPRVGNDHNQSIRLAISECRRRGYTRIGLAVQRDIMERVEEQWLAGFLVEHAYPQRRPTLVPLLVQQLDEKTFLRWFRAQRPDVILCGGNYQLLLVWLRRAGKKAPQDVGLVSLDLHLRDGSVAGIDQHSEDMGAAVVDHLIDRLHRNERGPAPHAARLHILGEWIDGATVRRG